MSNRRQWIVEWYTESHGKWSNVYKWDYEAGKTGWSYRKAMRLAAGLQSNKHKCLYRIRSLLTGQFIILN